jgi:hypothetical protein
MNGEIISVIRFTTLIAEGLTDLNTCGGPQASCTRGWVGWLVVRGCDTVCSES